MTATDTERAVVATMSPRRSSRAKAASSRSPAARSPALMGWATWRGGRWRWDVRAAGSWRGPMVGQTPLSRKVRSAGWPLVITAIVRLAWPASMRRSAAVAPQVADRVWTLAGFWKILAGRREADGSSRDSLIRLARVRAAGSVGEAHRPGVPRPGTADPAYRWRRPDRDRGRPDPLRHRAHLERGRAVRGARDHFRTGALRGRAARRLRSGAAPGRHAPGWCLGRGALSFAGPLLLPGGRHGPDVGDLPSLQ